MLICVTLEVIHLITMRINTKIRYGLRAMIEIAKHHNQNGILQKDISANQNISFKYLDPIINALKVAGLIKKTSHKGGYILSRDATEISVYDVFKAYEPEVKIIDCIDETMDCQRDNICDIKGFWCELNIMIVEKLKSTSIEQMLTDKKTYIGIPHTK